jgi:hypothetical protein
MNTFYGTVSALIGLAVFVALVPVIQALDLETWVTSVELIGGTVTLLWCLIEADAFIERHVKRPR